MNDSIKEAFNQVRELTNEIAAYTGSRVVIDRIQRKKAITFEIIPEGSPYGPQLRLSEQQMQDPYFMEKFLEAQAVKLPADINKLKEDMLEW